MAKKHLMTATVVTGCGFFILTGQEALPPAVYTASQMEAGRTAFQSSCAKCHTDTLIPLAGAKWNGQDIPPLAGTDFMAKWGARTTKDLSSRVKIAAGPDDKTSLDLTAYILQVNGARAGTQELTTSTAVGISVATRHE